MTLPECRMGLVCASSRAGDLFVALCRYALSAALTLALCACAALGVDPDPARVAGATGSTDGSARAEARGGQESTVPTDAASAPRVYPGNDTTVLMPPRRPPVALAGEAVSLNFEQAPVEEVVHSILGDILELDYVVDHPLPGEITLRTRSPVARAELLPILESLLQANGIFMIRDPNDRYFISQSAEMRQLLPALDNPMSEGAGFSNVIVPLEFISATGMAEILKPVAPESAFVRVDDARNLLILSGTRNQLNGWMEIIATFDIDQLQSMSVGVFPVESSSVEEVQAALQHLLANGEAAGVQDLARIVRVLPLERLGSILVVAPRAHYLETVGEWIRRLDEDTDASNEPSLHVYDVQNGSATHLAGLLGGIFGGGAGGAGGAAGGGVAPGLSAMSVGGGSSGAQAGGGQGAQMPATGGSVPAGGQVSLGNNVRIVADEYNNALLVFAPAREFEKIEAALKRLDVIANQVLIEASILEVTLADDLEFGLEWFIQNSLTGNREGSALLNVTGDSLGPRVPGFSYSVANSAGVLRAVLNALAERSLVNVISTPSVMVLDNHTAAIHVGDQQPIRSAQTVTNGGNVQVSIEFRDTGVKLEVTPSVNAGGLVTMDIQQSVTDVGPVDPATDQRSFLERNVSSRVSVRSGESVVLGGLIRDNKSRGSIGLPVLSGLPVVGGLFGRSSTTASRTELLVMITPKVVRNEQELRDVTQEMRSRMKGLRYFEDLPQGRSSTTGAGLAGGSGGSDGE